MKQLVIIFVCLFSFAIPYQSKAMTPDEIMELSFSLNSRTQEVYFLLQGIALKQEDPLASCNKMLIEFLQNVQNETLLPETRLMYVKDMLTYALAGLFIVNMDYENHPEQTKYGREFYGYFILSCAYLGAISKDNQDEQEKVLKETIMHPIIKFLINHRKENIREYVYKEEKTIYGSMELEIFPAMGNIVLLKFNDTYLYDEREGDIRTRDWSGMCIIKHNILTCQNNKEDTSEFSFQAKINDKNIIITEDKGFSDYVCGAGQHLRSKYHRAK